MFVYQIKVEYLGTNFVGWQIQKNGISIQGILERSLSKFFKRKISVIGSGRTDAGVHATEQSAHFKLNKEILKKNTTINSLNFFLKKYPISILDIKKRKKNFHARHSAKKRIYKYFIVNRAGSLAIEKNKAWHIRKKINIQLMKKGANLLKGTHDFSTFRASSCGAKSPIRTIKNITISKRSNKIALTFVSRSFLQQQVRSMVGALEYLGSGKWTLDYFKKVFLSKKRSMCASPAPPHGLYLNKIVY